MAAFWKQGAKHFPQVSREMSGVSVLDDKKHAL